MAVTWCLKFVFRLWLQTVKYFCNDTVTATTALRQSCTHESLAIDPLIALRCDERVFRCPPLFEIILQIFKGYLAVSKAKLASLSVHGPSELTASLSHEQEGKNSLAEREELRLALENTQDSVASQLLLQICLPNEQECQRHCNDRQLSDLQEIRCLVCSFLHQTFISNPTLVKLVHFQGYHLDLIPVLVNGVPSMHICRSFLLELLKQPQLSKQLFAVHLASHLSVRYPLMETMEVGQICFSHLISLFVSKPKQIRQEVALSILPAVCRFCRAFPMLCEKVAHLLLHVLRAAMSWVLMGSTRATFLEGRSSLLHVKDICENVLTPMSAAKRDCVQQMSHLCIKQDSFIIALQCVVSELMEIIRQW
jgi:integrator complex subunit 2